MSLYVTDGADLEAVADRIREAAGVETPLEFPDEFIQTIPDGIPKGLKIKYIIPATFIPPRTADDNGHAAFDCTFIRENVNQGYNVDWQLQDTMVHDVRGYWVQHIIWSWLKDSNYPNTYHGRRIDWFGAGKSGNFTYAKQMNYLKTALTQSDTFAECTTTDVNYKRFGNVFKGLIIVFDSTYDGLPIVDETKLSQFFECDYITAGW